MSGSPKTPTLLEVIQNAASFLDSQIKVALPAEFISYDSGTKKAVVQPMLSRVVDGKTIRASAVGDVLVLWPSTRRGHITFPLAAKDPCLLVVADRGLDPWLFNGIEAPPAEPSRSHDLSDAIAIPGLFSMGAGTVGADDSFEIMFDGLKIKINALGRVAIGNPTAELLDLVSQLITTLQSATVTTMLGLQPFTPPTQTLLAQIKVSLDSIKGTI